MVCFAFASRALRRPFAPVQNSSDNKPVLVNATPAPKGRTWHALQRACIRIFVAWFRCWRFSLSCSWRSAAYDASQRGVCKMQGHELLKQSVGRCGYSRISTPRNAQLIVYGVRNLYPCSFENAIAMTKWMFLALKTLL